MTNNEVPSIVRTELDLREAIKNAEHEAMSAFLNSRLELAGIKKDLSVISAANLSTSQFLTKILIATSEPKPPLLKPQSSPLTEAHSSCSDDPEHPSAPVDRSFDLGSEGYAK